MNIEKNIPMTKMCRGEASKTIKQMSVGDSVVVKKSKLSGFRSSARYLNKKLSVRSISETESRVWVVE